LWGVAGRLEWRVNGGSRPARLLPWERRSDLACSDYALVTLNSMHRSIVSPLIDLEALRTWIMLAAADLANV